MDGHVLIFCAEQGGKNRRRGKNENDNEKRELTFKEEGQGTLPNPLLTAHRNLSMTTPA